MVSALVCELMRKNILQILRIPLKELLKGGRKSPRENATNLDRSATTIQIVPR